MIEIVIRTPQGEETEYLIRVEGVDDPEVSRRSVNVIAAAVEMGCALLDAEFAKSPPRRKP